MNGRERVLAAINHKEPDRVPVDFGSTWCTSITIPAYEQLKNILGVTTETVLMERNMQVCMVDDRILEMFHVDTRGVFYGPPELEINKSVELGENVYIDAWGITWHKPKSSHYYDMLKPALPGNITLSDIMTHQWPTPHDPGYIKGLREKVEKQRRSTDCALVLNLSLWVLQCSQFIRGFEDWFVDLVSQPRLMEAIFDAITESLIGVLEDVTDEIGDLVDVVAVSDDIGHQDRLCMNPKMYRQLIKPRHAKLMEAIKSRTKAPVMWHTCGSVYEVIDDLIEIGVNVINPVQTDAAKMEAIRLKSDFGERLSFWGGIDTMRILPFGTTRDVEKEVIQKIRTLAPGGGYILNTVHNIQPIVIPENVVAMFAAAQKHGKYPINDS